MKKFLIIFGILLAFMPFLGFPQTWKDTYYVVLGLALFAASFLPRPPISRPKEAVAEKADENPS